MTHEEEEEMQHDISKLRDQVQQNSLSQKVTEAKMDGLKKGMEANMDGMEDNMDGLKKGMEAKMNDVDSKMDGLKKGMEAKMYDVEAKMEGKMEDLKIDLTKLLQEMFTNDERVVKKTHDENKRNVNHDFIDSNVGSKTHHVPKQYFNFHNVQNK